MNDRTTEPVTRKEMADSLRGIRRSLADPDYARAFCRAVLVNFRTGLAVVPRKCDGKWYPRKRG
jgi:hypothetical protein